MFYIKQKTVKDILLHSLINMYNALMKSISFAFNIFPAEQEAFKKNNYYFESPLLHASHVVPEYSSTKKI